MIIVELIKKTWINMQKLKAFVLKNNLKKNI